MELKESLCLLEERLVCHDNNRKEVQEKVREIHAKALEGADFAEKSINEEISKTFAEAEERILSLIEKINAEKSEDNIESLIKQAKEAISTEYNYVIKPSEQADDFTDLCRFQVTLTKSEKECGPKNVISQLRDYMSKISESIASVRNELAEICTKRRNEANEMERRINGKLEPLFTQEDARIQEIVKLLKENIDNENIDELKELKEKSKITLLKNQKYVLSDLIEESSLSEYDFNVVNEVSLKAIDFEERKPSDMILSFTKKNEFKVSFVFFSEDEKNILSPFNLPFKVSIKVWEKKYQNEKDAKTSTTEYTVEKTSVSFKEFFEPCVSYYVKVRIECSGSCTKWSDHAEIIAPDFKLCAWKESPNYSNIKNMYSVDEYNPRIATMNIDYYSYCYVIGNTPLPFNKVVSWSIKISKSKSNDEKGLFVGVAPFDIFQNDCFDCGYYGWYFDCYNSLLYSGPPHKYKSMKYGPTIFKKSIRTGSTVNVVMDTVFGTLSFGVNNKDYGIAYEGIPLDKLLVPSINLKNTDESVEFILPDVKEPTISVDPSIHVPSNIVTNNDEWCSITITWDDVKKASFYQVEIDGNRVLYRSSTNVFTKKGLLTDTEHSFKVRTVKGPSVSKWSDVVKVRTRKDPIFSECVWRERPNGVDECWTDYSVDKMNPRIVVSNEEKCIAITGDTPLPDNKVTSWNIRMVDSIYEYYIYTGVAPFDIEQNDDDNKNRCGWYLSFGDSLLYSGPPHNYDRKEYGQRKNDGGYYHTGDTIGVIMDITKGELSFVLNGMNYGVAYEGIPLDKPLVPCVIMSHINDSVELIIK